MTDLKVTIKNETGLHARPAAAFCKFCSQFENDIELVIGSMVINAKSILQVLSASLAKGTEIIVRVQGDNAIAVAQQVVDYIVSIKE